MFIVGLDLGKRKSQLCIQEGTGKVLAETRCHTTRGDLTVALSKFAGARVLLEASTSSQWVARHLRSLGFDVVIGDPRFGPMYAHANKKIKTDKRDARALADALRMGALKPVHQKSERSRRYHGELLVRAELVASRTRLINQLKALCEREGVIVGRCDELSILDELAEEDVPAWLGKAIAPGLGEIEALGDRIAACNKDLEATTKADPVARNLTSIYGVGPCTALAFIAAIDDPERFASAREVVAYIGFAPGQHNSGDSNRRPGAITKTGDPLLRGYLYEAAMSVVRITAPDTPLKTWGVALKLRKDFKRKAIVGVARRLARIMWAMWRDNKPFDPKATAPDDVSEISRAAA
jgi:transposase